MMTLQRFSVSDILLVLLFTLNRSCINCHDNPLVYTPLGVMEGMVKLIRNEEVYQFRNVPYAKPPTGNLRFAKPVPVSSWSGVLNATEFGPACMQPSYEGYIYDKYKPNTDISEDCLSLNVYIPRNISVNANRSVMVWIHGGSYYIGQGSSYDGSYLALTGDLVVVTLNYRLGMFGFLSSPENGITGNYGIWDQRLALEWIQTNIASFGGNPTSVTIFGQSAGGFAVSLLAIIPNNRGLFHRVISQSGSPEGAFALWQDAASVSKEIIRKSDCENNCTTTLTCMRNKPASELVSISRYIDLSDFANGLFILPSGPVVDKDLFPMEPTRMLTNRTIPSFRFFRSLDFMTGNVDTEGSVSTNIIQEFRIRYGEQSSFWMSSAVLCTYFLPGLLRLYFGEMINHVQHEILCSLYGTSNSSEQLQNAMHAYADANFIAPAVKSLLKHSEENHVTNSFQYLFRRPNIDPDIRQLYKWWTNGSTHGSDTSYLFGLEDYQELYNISVTPADISLSNKMLKYWTNFAKTGNPNSHDVPRWNAYDVITQNYVNLDTTITQDQHLYRSRVNIWLNVLPKLIQDHLPDIVVGK